MPTLDLIDAICTRLRVGAFERVAVEAVGVRWPVYLDWLRKGEEPDCAAEYTLLADEVRKARAEARLSSEMELRQKDPKTWLLCGPGRETPTQEGWGPASRKEDASADNAHGQLMDVIGVLLHQFPEESETRTNLAAAITRMTRFAPTTV
jgi:hypothetical protein